MKTLYVICLLIILSKLNLLGQTSAQRVKILEKTNVTALQQMSIDYGSIAAQKRSIAEQKAIAHGFPISGVSPNGNAYYIYDYDSLNGPQYNTTFNLNAAKTISTDKVWGGVLQV